MLMHDPVMYLTCHMAEGISKKPTTSSAIYVIGGKRRELKSKMMKG